MLNKKSINIANSVWKLWQGHCRRLHVFGSSCASKSCRTDLLSQLEARIQLNGPITVADYMKEVLTNPVAGYYMHRDVFGAKGDFITSPEISQMFGELLGIWCVNEWMQCGSPAHLQVVELGPGRGTLAADMLRVFSQFEALRERVSLHLVEVSPTLSQIQEEKLCDRVSTEQILPEPGLNESLGGPYKKCRSSFGPDVFWYYHLPDVPRAVSFFIAHEFFDALPIHKFQKQDGNWHEVLIDLEESPMSEHHLRYVLSRGPTTAMALLLEQALSSVNKREHVEVCPEGGVLAQELANRVALDGGFALIADYGHDGTKTDTFRAFKEHKLHNPLSEPGTADLTADVDFTYLKTSIDGRAACYGPTTQNEFLHNMGIGVRLQMLLGNANIQQRKDLLTSYDMLTNQDKMGERFKFLALLRHRPGNYIPAGFKPLE